MSRSNDLLSAALRHVRDAEHLLEEGPGQSIDQAYHLSGFGPECARKACLREGWGDQALGHRLDGTLDHILELMLALDPHARRYGLARGASTYPALAAWKVECRYRETARGSTLPARTHEATAAVREARAVVDDLSWRLFADGRVDDGAFAL